MGAQPRPVLNVPPRGIGPITDPNENDVLCGRGGRINSHAGNVQFRDIIHSKKSEYLDPSTKNFEKAHIAAGIVSGIRTMDPAGRFLKEDKGTGMWFDIGDAKAIKKAGQALREDAPDIRKTFDIGDTIAIKKTGQVFCEAAKTLRKPSALLMKQDEEDFVAHQHATFVIGDTIAIKTTGQDFREATE